MLCDGEGHPLHFELSAGQTHEAAAFEAVMTGADDHLRDVDGQPVAWPVALAASAASTVSGGVGRRAGDARPVEFDRHAYRDRNIVERLIGWLKECRRVFSRYEKTAKNFAGMIRMAFIQRYLRLAVE